MFLFATIPISSSPTNVLSRTLCYVYDDGDDLERRPPEVFALPRESSILLPLPCSVIFVKMVAYILHSRSVFLFHQLPPLCATVHNHIPSDPRSAQLHSLLEAVQAALPPLKFNELLVVYYFLSHNVPAASRAGQTSATRAHSNGH